VWVWCWGGVGWGVGGWWWCWLGWGWWWVGVGWWVVVGWVVLGVLVGCGGGEVIRLENGTIEDPTGALRSPQRRGGA
jgi:hypothetical protein